MEMKNGVIEEKLKDIKRLIGVIYSADMEEESEELQEMWNSLVGEIERLEKALESEVRLEKQSTLTAYFDIENWLYGGGKNKPLEIKAAILWGALSVVHN